MTTQPAGELGPYPDGGGRLYVGEVMHERTRPVRNAFHYGVYFLYVDVDRLDELAERLRAFGHNSGGPLRVDDADHGPRDGSPLRPWIDGVLECVGIDLQGGPVCLLTFPRALGFRFFPVSFWYCFHADGSLRAVMAEVSNTFGEHHDYLLHDGGEPMDWSGRPTATKVFHVSPFIEMDARYTFRFTEPAEKLGVTILDDVEGERLLTASIALHAREMSDAELWRAFRRFGPMSLRAAMLIGWQALRIRAKGVHVVHKPPPPEEEVSL